MKKIFIIFLCGILFLPGMVKAETDITPNAKSALLIEASTGKVLYQKNAQEKVAIASLTKMMSQIIVLEQIEQGKIKWDDVVTASSNAAGYGGTQIYLQPGEKMTVEDLFKGVSMASANDAVVALAEFIAGSEDAFVKLMMEKAKELGLKNTNFVNPTGLDQEGHYSTAEDLGIIARELVNNHPKILEFSSMYEDYLRENTENKFWLVNTNKLIRFYDGADGLKTGFTDAAKYCMTVTAKRNNMRLIAIILGEEVSKVRNAETTALLDYGFQSYQAKTLKEKGIVVDKIQLERSNKKEIELILKDDIQILEQIGTTDKKYQEKIKLNNYQLPIKKGDVLGKLQIYDENKLVSEYDLIAKEDAKKQTLLSYYSENLKKIIMGS
ncbi:MAG: D-alanyl-D-alanine carboxypeptidase [Bacilli bacterium]|nr:D-alanyl-D-alanine carboxypeptidase [Bacilli bacterium]